MSATPPPNKPRRRVLQNVIFTLLARAQGAVFTYVIIRLLLDMLSIEQYGLHSLLFVGVMMNMSMLAQFGLHGVGSRYLPEYYSASRFGLIQRLFGYLAKYQFLAGMAVALLAVVLAPQIARWINYPGYSDLIRIFALAGFAYLFSNLFQVLFGAVFQQRVVLLVSMIYNVLRLGGLIVVAAVWGTFQAVVISETIAVCAMTLLYWGFYLRVRRKWPREEAGPSPHPRSRYRRYATWSYAGNVGATMLSMAADLLLVSTILGGVATGYYGLASRIDALALKFLPDRLLQPVMQPLFFSEYARKQEQAGFGFTMLVKATMLVSMAVGLWLALMSEPVIVELFDPRYAEAAGVVSILAIFIPLAALRRPFGLVIQNAERVEFFVYDKAAAVLKIGFGILLLPVYGIMAMVWLNGLAILLQLLILYFLIATQIKVRLDLWGVLKLILNGAAAAGLFILIRPYFTGLWGTLLSPLPWALIYFGINLLNKPFRADERVFINQHLKYKLWRF